MVMPLRISCIFIVFAVLTTCGVGRAQVVTPGPEIANAVVLGQEGITIASVSGNTAPVVGQLGVGSTWAPSVTVTPPLYVTCAVAAQCALVGGDAAPGTVKTFVVQRQATSYQVYLQGVTTPVTVPALPTPTAPDGVTGTYTINGTATLTIYSDGSFTLSGTGITAVSQ
jgi:hypothetical protein